MRRPVAVLARALIPARLGEPPPAAALFIERFDPLRMSRDVRARRQVLSLAEGAPPGSERQAALNEVVRILAAVYGDPGDPSPSP